MTYLHCVSCLEEGYTLDYHIIETKKMCNEGARLFENNTQVHFHTELPAYLPEVDIIYMSSVLQYIEEYASLIKALCAYKPRYFLFAKLSAGDIHTYATIQKNMPGMEMRYWFVNVREIIKIMSECGYVLLFKGACLEEYQQVNFPEEYRLVRPCHLLFFRDKQKLPDKKDEKEG